MGLQGTSDFGHLPSFPVQGPQSFPQSDFLGADWRADGRFVKEGYGIENLLTDSTDQRFESRTRTSVPKVVPSTDLPRDLATGSQLPHRRNRNKQGLTLCGFIVGFRAIDSKALKKLHGKPWRLPL
jgi:hypothetical protein